MKRTSRQLAAALAIALALGLVLVACANEDSANSGAPDRSTSEGIENPEKMHDHDESTPIAEGARRIEVKATSFAYDPNEITVSAGEDVAIVLSSDDLLHDFTVDGIDVHVAADRGETAEGGLRAEKPGEYTFYCTVPGHREAGMEGTLVVEEP